MYTDRRFAGVVRVLRQPGAPGNLQTLIEKHCIMPGQQRLHQVAKEASRLDFSLDDRTIVLIEDSISAGTRP